jgi:hypothetical protein
VRATGFDAGGFDAGVAGLDGLAMMRILHSSTLRTGISEPRGRARSKRTIAPPPRRFGPAGQAPTLPGEAISAAFNRKSHAGQG